MFSRMSEASDRVHAVSAGGEMTPANIPKRTLFIFNNANERLTCSPSICMYSFMRRFLLRDLFAILIQVESCARDADEAKTILGRRNPVAGSGSVD